MSAVAVLYEYPEFAAAAVIGAALFGARSFKGGFPHVPEALAAPAKALFLSLPDRYVGWLGRTQTWAGLRSNSSFGDICSIKVYSAVLSLLAALLVPLYVVPFLAAVMFFIPDLAIVWLAKRRQQRIIETLPQTIDLMVLCVDAGLGLDATLQRVVSETSVAAGALNDELMNLGRDVLLGMNRERAYREIYNRTGVDEMKTLASALNQSSKLGLSISKILRSQSEYLRGKQSQKVEERAHKLPIYMAFPLWFFIMPTFMLIVLGPSLITFLQQAQPGLIR